MKFSIAQDSDATVLQIEGELDAVTVPELRPELDRLAESGASRVVVDLGRLRLIDSSGVGAIVSLYRRLRAAGGQVVVRNATAQPRAIFALLKLDRVLFEEAVGGSELRQ